MIIAQTTQAQPANQNENNASQNQSNAEESPLKLPEILILSELKQKNKSWKEIAGQFGRPEHFLKGAWKQMNDGVSHAKDQKKNDQEQEKGNKNENSGTHENVSDDSGSVISTLYNFEPEKRS